MNYIEKMPILIFSVEKRGLSIEENHNNTKRAKKSLSESKIPFKVVYGNYEGCTEISFLVEDNAVNRNAVATLCLIYEQECYLSSDKNRLTKLIYPNKTITLGILKVADRQDITENYTIDPLTGLKWTTGA